MAEEYPGENAGDRWAFVLKVQDRPGALAAITNAFSSRGVSLETALGSGGEAGGTVVLGFRATERKRALLQRVVQRLSHVEAVQSYPYQSPELRVIAVVRVNADDGLEPLPAGVHVEQVCAGEDDGTYMLAGTGAAVETALAGLQGRGVLLDAVRTLIAV